MLDVAKIRQDFTILRDSKAPIYFDNACMSLKPDSVVSAINEYYFKYPACEGRSAHRLSEEVTKKVKETRKIVAEFINAKETNEIIFTRNTTEGINLLANSLDLKRGDRVLITDKEHNSNLVPWLCLKNKIGIEVDVVRGNIDGTFNLENFKEKVIGAKLVSFVHTSNLDGVTNPAREIIEIAHQNGILVFFDMAQSVMHQKIDVRDLDVDFIAFSGHKILGPTGTGVFYGKKELLEKLTYFMVGGDTVFNSTYTDFQFLPAPERFEAGLFNYADIIGLGEALKYFSQFSFEDIREQELLLNKYITEEISKHKNVKIIGPESAEERAGIVNFYIEDTDMHQFAVMLDQMAGICVRSGWHCVHSWFNDKKIKNSARVSLAFYNTKEEVEVFVENFNKIMKII